MQVQQRGFSRRLTMPNTDIAMFHVTDGAPTRLDSAEKNFDTVQEKRLELACEAPGHEDTLPCCAAGENHSFDGLCGESFDASTKDLGCGKLPSGLHCQCGHELSEELNASFIPMSAQRPADVKERVLQHSRSGPGGLAGAGVRRGCSLESALRSAPCAQITGIGTRTISSGTFERGCTIESASPPKTRSRTQTADSGDTSTAASRSEKERSSRRQRRRKKVRGRIDQEMMELYSIAIRGELEGSLLVHREQAAITGLCERMQRRTSLPGQL
mmetsp:Transcript_1345/g.2680  ORF Transcript_1345/g.2680 Transcript_1345/m.2680 type:complete len:272 (-) Transcript_1345:12-827(-)